MQPLQKLAVLGLTLLGTAGAGGQAALTPALLAGTWQGSVTEPDAGLNYEMTAQIAARPDAQGRFASVHYTSGEGCDVAWFLQGQTARQLTVQEKVLSGSCVDVTLQLTLDRSGKRPALQVISHDTGDGLGGQTPTVTLQATLERR